MDNHGLGEIWTRTASERLGGLLRVGVEAPHVDMIILCQIRRLFGEGIKDNRRSHGPHSR
jgi:hypothetical protein